MASLHNILKLRIEWVLRKKELEMVVSEEINNEQLDYKYKGKGVKIFCKEILKKAHKGSKRIKIKAYEEDAYTLGFTLYVKFKKRYVLINATEDEENESVMFVNIIYSKKVIK